MKGSGRERGRWERGLWNGRREGSCGGVRDRNLEGSVCVKGRKT